MTTEKTCLDCGTVLHGRADKKFCNDLCRNNYNNQLNSSSYNLVRNINNILRRNRRILEELNPTGKTKTTGKKMRAKGFDFEYHTRTYQTQNGKPIIFAMSTATCRWRTMKYYWLNGKPSNDNIGFRMLNSGIEN